MLLLLKRIRKWTYIKRVEITLVSILILSLLLRFINYSNRWGLAYDQARDIIVASYALNNHLIPLIGPFSASGPFVFGPYAYWMYMFFISLQPSNVILPWIFQTAISALMPLIMFLVGKEVLNKKFGLLLAFFTAISTAQIAQATNLTYSTFVGFVSMLVFLFAIKAIKYSKDRFFFLTAFFVGFAVNIHFQAIGLLIVLPLILIFSRFSIRRILLVSMGLVSTFIPLIIFDFIGNHYESSHLIKFFLSGGNEFSLPNRWLTYIGIFWPKAFSHVIGGYFPMGYVLGFLLLCVTVYSFVSKKFSKLIFFVLSFFVINIIILRYFKGGIYDAFLVYMHPSILILTAYVVLILKRKNLFLAIFLFISISILTINKNIYEIKYATNYTSPRAIVYMNDLRNKFPQRKFSLYDYGFKNVSISYPTVMYLMKNELADSAGKKIGFADATNSAQFKERNAPLIEGEAIGGPFMMDLSEYTDKELDEMGWFPINPDVVYNSVERWIYSENK
jgi:hypothetical protein